MTQTADDSIIRTVVLNALGRIAPEADLAALDPNEDIREQLDVDSVDFLNFVLAIDQDLGIEVPEVDYRKLRTLDGCIAYLQLKQPKPIKKEMT
jgi:acyl carrier protein